MSRPAEFAATVVAGAAGATIAAVAIGASLLLVLPAAVGIGAIAMVAQRRD